MVCVGGGIAINRLVGATVWCFCGLVSGGGGGGWCRGGTAGGWGGRGWVLRWFGVWASRRVVWVLPVRAVRSLWSLAGCGAEVWVGGGRMGIQAGLLSVGSGWLPGDGACMLWGVGRGAPGGAGVLLLGPGAAGARARLPARPWGRMVVGMLGARVVGAVGCAGSLGRVLRVCWPCVVPWRWWVRCQGLVVVVHVMVRCREVCRVGWVARGARLRWGVVVMQLPGVAVVLGHRGVGVGRDGRVAVMLGMPCPQAPREWWSWQSMDVCGRWLLAGLPG